MSAKNIGGNWYIYTGGKTTFIKTNESNESNESNNSGIVCDKKHDFSEVYSKSIDGVVHITNYKYAEFKYEDDDSIYITYNRASGTGFYTNIKNGYIVTAAHVVKPHDLTLETLKASEWVTEPKDEYIITDYLQNKMIYAKLIGVDYVTDIAVLKLNDNIPSFKTLKFRDSRDVKIGEHCLVLGNPSSHFIRSVSAGVVRDNKALDLAELPESVMTDADIIEGNSGGPLIDIDGNVIGIVSYSTKHNGGCIASHIVIDSVKYFIENEEENTITRLNKGYLGAKIIPVSNAANLKKAEFFSKITEPYPNVKFPDDYDKSTGYMVYWEDIENSIFYDNNINFPKPFDIIEEVSINDEEYIKVGADNEDFPLRTIIHLAGFQGAIKFKYRKATEKYKDLYESINIELKLIPEHNNHMFTSYVSNIEKVIKKLN